LKAGKAYISSLGTTGVLVASSLILLVVVGTLIAFDAWPLGAAAGKPETVALGSKDVVAVKAKQAHSSGSSTRATVRSGARATGRASARAARAGNHKPVVRDDGRPIQDDGVVSGLPHPTADPDGGSGGGGGGHALPPPNTPGAPGGPNVPLPTSTAGSAVSAGRETTHDVASVVTGVSPQAGALVEGVGQTVDSVVGTILPDAAAQGR
jgi:hypothetical protein